MRKPSTATIIATVALFVALGGAGMAATGGSFILGQPNTATTNTSLSAPVAGGKTLQVTNNDTSNAASTALGLTVASGHAPFTVNTGIKVTNLNADKLDGIDSTGFLSKTGTAVDSSKLGGQPPSHFLPVAGKAADADKLDGIDSTGFIQGNGKANAAALMLQASSTPQEYALESVPGFGIFSAECPDFGRDYGTLTFTNTSGGALDMTLQTMRVLQGSATPYAVGYPLANNMPVSVDIVDYAHQDVETASWQLTPATTASPVVTAFTSIMFDGGNCVFKASYAEGG